jgi:Uma2 family endonuclease
MTLATAKRFTIEEYYRLIDLEMLQKDDRTELIEGEIIKMVAKGKPHAVCCRNLIRELSKLVGDRATLQCQDPIMLSNYSEPEPDLAIARNRDDNYLANHPTPEDILLVIEIADSSLEYDREIKLGLYAKSGITDYWIFNLIENQLEVYRHPYQKSQSNKFDYRQKQIFLPNETVALPGLADAILDLAKVFPDANFSETINQ